MDIDKLFLSGLNYKTEGVENIYGYVEQHLVKESELTEEHQLQNKIIDMYLALLIDKKDNGGPRNVQILHRSIDNDTDLAKSVLKDIEGSGKSKTETPYSFYSLARQTASKNDYITGKVGIGPFALNNNNQILTMIYHISFRESQSSLLSTLGLSRLDKQLDVDGNSIMSWISAMINAHVDIAKDPWISRLNVNPFSYNITNLLLRTGWGGNTFYFLTQPIMKQMADAYVKASSQYMQQNGSTYSRQQQSIKDVAEQYFGKDVTFDGNTLDDALSLIDAGDKESIQAINKAIKKLLESEQFKQDARDYAQGNDVADQKGLKSRQLGIYLAYVQFSKYANALANLVKYCKIDTKKHGKSAAEQLVYKEGFDELFEFATDEDGVLIKKGDVGALFEPAGLLDLVEHSYVGTKTRNAISLTKVILGRQFMSSTTGFIQMLRQLNTMAGNTSLSVSFVQSAQKALSAAIKSEFFNDYASRISDNPRYMHDLVNSSSEDLEFSYDASTNSMSITGNKHSLKSYVGQPILLWYKDKDGNLQQYIPRDKNGNALPLKVLTAKDDKIQLNISINGNFNGVCRLLGGANTIFDRLSRLKPMIYHNNDYSDLQGNLLLEMLIPGKRVEYSPKDAVLGERPDTYDDLKFVKLQNFVDDGGINTNYIINAWNELLEYQNDKQPQVAEYIRDFARDLIVYAFITSGDTQGFTKMFKYVPASWRKKSGYADFINRKLVQLNSIPTIDLNDVLLNNWYDNKLVPTYQFYSKDANGKRSSNFIGVAKMKIINGNKQTQSAYPTILAALKKNDEGMYEPSIAVESSPKFIKIPRSYNHYDSQRQYNVYQLYGFARHDSGIMYPVYVLVQPKGTKVSGGFMVTEYGRNDSTPSSTEYVVNQGALRAFVESADFINQLPAIKKNFGDEYAAILNDLRTEQTGGVAAAITDDYQAQPINTGNQSSTAQTATVVNPLTISDKTEAFGVTVDPKLKQNYKRWLVDHPNGIIAYRINYNNFNTAENVNKSIIGNPFDWQKYGQEKSLQMFYEWLTTGVNHNEALATEEYRNAIINKLLSIDKPEVLYYKELGHPSHATVIGYLIEHKELLQPQSQTSAPTSTDKKSSTDNTQQQSQTNTDSSEKSVTEQLVQHLKDSGFTVYGIDKNDIEKNEDYQFATKRPNVITYEKHKKEIDLIYDDNPELSSIGSKEQYSEYLSTIFPNSETPNIYYHGGRKGIDEFMSPQDAGFAKNKGVHSGTKDYGIYFTADKSSAKRYSKGYKKSDRQVYSVLLNTENPYRTNKFFALSIRRLFGSKVLDPRSILEKDFNTTLKGYDSVIWHGEKGEIVVFDPSQIHILGSKSDIEGFKDYVKSSKYNTTNNASSVQFAIEPISTETDDYEQILQTILDEAPRDSKGRLLAPNGKPSNLPERLYAQVRTKEFKDWFGDWEKVAYSSKYRESHDIPNSITSAIYKGVGVSEAMFDPDMAPDGGKRLIFLDKDDTLIGEIPVIESKDKIRMSGSVGTATEIEEEYRGKGYGKKAHLALANIAKSEGKVLYSDKSNSDAEDALWKSLVKDGIAEVVSESPKVGHWNHTQYRIINDKLPQADDINSGDRGVSKVVDENGEPRVVYHGSKSIFNVFNSSESESRQWLSKQIKPTNFFSSDETVADFFAVTENQMLAAKISKSIDTILDAFAGEDVDKNVLDDEIWTEAAKNTGKSKEFVKDFWENKVPREYKMNDEFGTSKMEDSNIDKYKYNVFLNMKSPIILDAEGERANSFIEANKEVLNNNDEIIIINIDETVGRKVTATDYLVRNPNQIKSAGGENKTFSRTNNNIHFFKDSKGVVYGYVDNDGIIHLNKNKIRPEHPIHEYTHIWDRVVALKNPSLWIRGVELMKQFDGGKLWNEIANSEFYGKKWSNMSDAQREFMIASEVHARLVGEGGAKLISEIEAKQGSSDIISKLKDWILKFWQSLKQTFSNWSKEDIEALTLKDFNHMTLRDFVTSNTYVAFSDSDARLSMSVKLELVGLTNYSSGIDVSEDVQRAIDKINAISPNEQQYITPVITGESSISGVSLIDAINIAAKIKSANRHPQVSDKIVREKISQVEVLPDEEVLFNLLNLGTVPNNLLLMLADYINYDDARGIVAGHIAAYLERYCQKKSYYDVAIPIIKSIDVKYDDSRQQSQFNDDIMKHCKGN